MTITSDLKMFLLIPNRGVGISTIVVVVVVVEMSI